MDVTYHWAGKHDTPFFRAGTALGLLPRSSGQEPMIVVRLHEAPCQPEECVSAPLRCLTVPVAPGCDRAARLADFSG